MSKVSIGLAMIMQDESVHIPTSIAQFYHVVGDIVVVDGGSEDDSVLWADRMGAKVIKRQFEDDFSAQKNFAIENLQTDWVYLHDPDERLEPPLLEIIPMLVTKEGQEFLMKANIIPDNEKFFDCFGIPRRNFIDGIQSPIYPDYQYRLFRNYCRFKGPVYEEITNFSNRTELDYKRLGTETGVPDAAQWSRFNILHYKSSTKQGAQEELYRKIRLANEGS